MSVESTELKFTDFTEGSTEPMAIDIASCLTDSLAMKNECSSYNYGLIVEPFNWWVTVGAYVAAFGIVVFKSLWLDGRREIVYEVFIYGSITILVSAILVTVGFNVYIVNYLMDSPKYFYTFINFTIFGTVIALLGDSYYYRNNRTTRRWKSGTNTITKPLTKTEKGKRAIGLDNLETKIGNAMDDINKFLQ